MPPKPTNGVRKILWSLIILLAGVITTLVGAWANHINNTVADHTKAIAVNEQRWVEVNTKLDMLLKAHNLKLEDPRAN